MDADRIAALQVALHERLVDDGGEGASLPVGIVEIAALEDGRAEDLEKLRTREALSRDHRLVGVKGFSLELQKQRRLLLHPQRKVRRRPDGDHTWLPAQAAEKILHCGINGLRIRILRAVEGDVEEHAAVGLKPGIDGPEIGEAADEPAGARNEND